MDKDEDEDRTPAEAQPTSKQPLSRGEDDDVQGHTATAAQPTSEQPTARQPIANKDEDDDVEAFHLNHPIMARPRWSRNNRLGLARRRCLRRPAGRYQRVGAVWSPSSVSGPDRNGFEVLRSPGTIQIRRLAADDNGAPAGPGRRRRPRRHGPDA